MVDAISGEAISYPVRITSPVYGSYVQLGMVIGVFSSQEGDDLLNFFLGLFGKRALDQFQIRGSGPNGQGITIIRDR